MSIQHFPERKTDKSEQILSLLSELSARLRTAENERDMLREDFHQLRDFVQEIDHQSNQAQKSILLAEGRIDPLESTMQSLIRRLTGLEDAIERQNTTFLSILHKIQEQFDAYEAEAKDRAAQTSVLQNQWSRRIEELEFHLLGKTPPLPMRMTSNLPPIGKKQDPEQEDLSTLTSLVENHVSDTPQSSSSVPLGVWAPEDMPPTFINENDSSFVSPPRWRQISGETWAKILQGIAFACFVVLLIGIGYSGLQSVLNMPPDATKMITDMKAPASTAKNGTQGDPTVSSFSFIPESILESKPGSVLPEQNDFSSSSINQKSYFSTDIRHQMDVQMIAARKVEDSDAARLLIPQTTPLATRAPKDNSLPAAIKPLLDRALIGNPQAGHDLAALYATGRQDVKIDYTRAAFWFAEAARGGMPNARYNLGVLYQQGLGVEKDMDAALAWYRTAALLDHPEARYNLGIAAAEGIGMAYNPAMAAGYFEGAARGGVVEAAYNLGDILEKGLIDGPRVYESMFWYALASAGGHEPSKKALDRLKKSEKLSDRDWVKLYQNMQKARPDLQALINSRR